MKKLTRKLFLSVAALAVCAATLVSTTFAWYVNNPTASVGDTAGSTTTAGSTGSISVSNDGTNFYKSVATAGEVENANTLEPVTPVDATAATFKDLASTTENPTVSGKVMTFSIWVKSDIAVDAGAVTVTLTTTNTTTDKKAQTNQTPAGGADAFNSKVAGAASFYVDAIDALRMSVSADGAAPTIYQVNKISKNYSYVTAPTGATLVKEADGINAHTYYKVIKGADPSITTEVEGVSAATAIAMPALVAGTAVKLTFKVWLEGADQQCFNACAGQSFKFAFDFALPQGSE